MPIYGIFYEQRELDLAKIVSIRLSKGKLQELSKSIYNFWSDKLIYHTTQQPMEIEND